MICLLISKHKTRIVTIKMSNTQTQGRFLYNVRFKAFVIFLFYFCNERACKLPTQMYGIRNIYIRWMTYTVFVGYQILVILCSRDSETVSSAVMLKYMNKLCLHSCVWIQRTNVTRALVSVLVCPDVTRSFSNIIINRRGNISILLNMK